jgi:L-ascorbate metabolism protein UlaG (beta-lactamase superfamily)
MLRAAALAALVVLSAVAAGAQTRDVIPATGGNITIIPVYHGSLQVLHVNRVIDVDPAAPANFNGLAPATLVLVTDIHDDHLDAGLVARLRAPMAAVIAPAAAAGALAGSTAMANGETRSVAGMTIEAVPMYNLVRGPAPGQLFHTKGRGNGYIVTVGGKRLYFAGDTECTPEMKALANIDVAFIPMILPYTMPPSEAAECVKAFKPKIVYPYHYMGANLSEFADALRDTGIEVRLREWYSLSAK